jgi:hypothetical protein
MEAPPAGGASHSGLRYLLRLSLMPLAGFADLVGALIHPVGHVLSMAFGLVHLAFGPACGCSRWRSRWRPSPHPLPCPSSRPSAVPFMTCVISQPVTSAKCPGKGGTGLDPEPAIAGRSSSPSPAKGKGRRGGERQGNQERTRDGPHWLRRPFQAQRGAVESGEQIGGIAVNRHAARPA